MKKILFTLMLMLGGMNAAWAQDDDFVNVDTTEKLWNAIKANASAKVRLTRDIALSDIDKDNQTYCNGNTFHGTIDGGGHILKGDPVASVRSRTFMFANADGATFKNLTFKGIRIDSREKSNQAVLTSQANDCVFENITFDNVSIYTSYDNAGAVVGTATNCTFKDITVKDSDITVNRDKSGAVVGDAKNCNFEDIRVEHSESTARHEMSGGVAGCIDDCAIRNVEIVDSYIKTEEDEVGGIAGVSYRSYISTCTIDDQSCVFSDGTGVYSYAGGIVGFAEANQIQNCINSALIAGDDNVVGGIAGYARKASIGEEITHIEYCLNAGMIISIKEADINEYYRKYKNKQLPCVTKSYNGIEYVVRKTDLGDTSDNYFGGIAGELKSSTISRCANLGSMNRQDYTGGLVGLVEGKSTICDCLSDVETPSSNVYGLFGDFTNDSDCHYTITNCLNTSQVADDDGNHSRATFVINNLFSYKSGTLEINELSWGKVCLSLGVNWQQNIGIDPYPTPTGYKTIYHSRSITNEYGTAFLPFSVDSDEDISFYTFEGETTDEAGINLNFTYVEHVPAHTPVLFRASGDPTAENPLNITITDARGDYQWRDTYSPTVGWGMEGTYKQRVIDGNEAKSTYYLSDGVFKNAQTVSIPACRAYLHGPSIETLTGSGAARVRIVIDGEENEVAALQLVTDDSLSTVEGRGEAYTLFGTKAGKGYRGIVVRGGKLTVNN